MEMNIWLQILIGLSPFVVVSAVTMIMRRWYTLQSILAVSAGLLVVSFCSVMVFTAPDDRRTSAERQDEWYMLGVYILEGDLDTAEQLLDDLYASGSYDERHSLYKARLALLGGDYEQAAILYDASRQLHEKYGNDRFPADEYETFAALAQTNGDGETPAIRDEALYRYLEKQGIRPADYGLVSVRAAGLASQTGGQPDADRSAGAPSSAQAGMAGILARQQKLVLDHIQEELREMRESDPAMDELDSYVNLILDTNEMFEAYSIGQEPDGRELRKIVRRFEELSETQSGVMESKELKLARMKALIMDGNLRKIPEVTGSSPDLNELVVLSELYITGIANRSDYAHLVSDEQREKYDRVIAQAEKVYNEQYQSEPKVVRKQVKSQIDALRVESRHLPLAEIRNQITEIVRANESREKSKIYLQLSKIENYLGNDTKSDEAMNEALTSAVYSTDTEYAAPMRKIIEILHNKADSEEIKNVPNYVETAVRHSLPLPLQQAGATGTAGSKPKDTSSGNQSGGSDRPFEQYFTEYVSRKRAELSIGKIDTSQFPYIEARIQLSHDLDVKNIADLLEVYDQGIKIEDFTIEKLNFDSSRIMLLTDNSGSMSRSVGDLKLAVQEFINGMNNDEEVSIVTFDNRIRIDSGFLSDTRELLDVADRLGAYGGTDVYGSLLYGIDQFPQDAKSNHIIILMTDGLDGSMASEQRIRDTIGAKSLENGITIYTIGLGTEVDTAYLETIARYGNGSFIYASDAASLRTFYDFIHLQAANQYVLRYRAKNTVDVDRELSIRIPQTNTQATKTYRLHGGDSQPADDDSLVRDRQGDIRLYGLDTKLLYRGSGGTSVVTLRGEGFEKLTNLAITFSGPSDYAIGDASVVDDGNIKLRIPDTMMTGVYDVVVLADGNRYILPDEFELAVPGGRKTVTFGPYKLSAQEIIQENDRTYRLKGRVTLNDYIQFRGELVLQGDPEKDLKITLTDQYGSSIIFDPHNSVGLSRMMANLGISLDFSAFGTFDLYLDERHLDDFESYAVDRIGSKDKAVKLWGMSLENSSLYIYPDSVKIDFNKIKLIIPYQDALLRFAGESPFIIENQSSAQITPNNVALITTLSTKRDDGLKSFTIGKLPVDLQSITASINTLKHDYEIEARVALEVLPSVDNFGLKLGVKGGKFDTIMLFADFPVPISKAPVPISLSNFGLGVQDMSKVPQGSNFKETLLNSYLSGQLDVSVADIKDILPFMRKILPDVPLLVFSDTTIKARVRDFSLLFSSNIDLFGKLTLASVDVRFGHFDYSNYVLNIPEQQVTGLFIEANQSLDWNTENIKIDYSGAISATFNSLASGLSGRGNINYEIDWFFIDSEKNYYGDLWIGVHAPGGKPQFTILIKGTELKNNRSGEKGVRLVFKEGSLLPKVTLY